MFVVPNYETLCKLSKDKACQLIENTDTVMYKSGVWNKYSECKTSDVMNWIRSSGWGADVRIDKETGVYYVCTPTASDMW